MRISAPRIALVEETGRWVLCRNRGIFYDPGHGEDRDDDHLQWELNSWRWSLCGIANPSPGQE
jgi:hypothetical protein